MSLAVMSQADCQVPRFGFNADARVSDCRCPEEGLALCWLRLYSGRRYSFTLAAIGEHREHQHC
jgi:hypothetical protein